jgi:hypothetical protein
MSRRTVILLVAAGLAVFGIWRLLNALPLLLSGEPYSGVPLALLIHGLLAVAAAVALFIAHGIAALLVILLAVAVAITALLESFVWMVLAPLGGLLTAVVVLVAAFFFARFLGAKA